MTTLSVVRTALHTRVARVFPEQIRAAVAPLTDEQIWWRPNDASNSIGNLILHLAGSINHFLNRNVGGMPYERDRAAEFAERRQIPKDELMAIFAAMVAQADRTFDELTEARLSEPSPEPKMHAIVLEDLINVALHLSNHAGQIVWIAKTFDAAALDEVWIRTHKSEGAWTPRPRA